LPEKLAADLTSRDQTRAAVTITARIMMAARKLFRKPFR